MNYIVTSRATSHPPSLLAISVTKLLLDSLTLSSSELNYLRIILHSKYGVNTSLPIFYILANFDVPPSVPSLLALSTSQYLFATFKFSSSDLVYLQDHLSLHSYLRQRQSRTVDLLPRSTSEKIKLGELLIDKKGERCKDRYTIWDNSNKGRMITFDISFKCDKQTYARKTMRSVWEDNFQEPLIPVPPEIGIIRFSYSYQGNPPKGEQILIYDSSPRHVPQNFPIKAQQFFLKIAEILELDLEEFTGFKKPKGKKEKKEVQWGDLIAMRMVEMFVGKKGAELFKTRMEAAGPDVEDTSLDFFGRGRGLPGWYGTARSRVELWQRSQV